MLEDSISIVLVITDIYLPGKTNGLELANIIWSRWPRLRVTVRSGKKSVLDRLLPDSTWPNAHCGTWS
jgi:DNA-binding NarL/FixJ family response regulator